MFSIIRRAGTLRAVVLVVSVSAASAFAMGVATNSFAVRAASSPSAVQTRSVSCGAFGFVPVDSATNADYFNSKRIRAGTSGSGFFTCNPGLADRAVVTKVQFSVWDGSGSSQMKFCGLYRSGLGGASSAETVQEMASFPGTGIARAPGFARLTDTSIHNSTVNTRSYVYWLQCNIEQAGQSLGLYGADVEYRITAANG
jgi:hypothetical protein